MQQKSFSYNVKNKRLLIIFRNQISFFPLDYGVEIALYSLKIQLNFSLTRENLELPVLDFYEIGIVRKLLSTKVQKCTGTIFPNPIVHEIWNLSYLGKRED